MGVDYWTPLFDVLRNTFVANRTIDEHDLNRLVLTDNVLKVAQLLSSCPSRPTEVSDAYIPTRKWPIIEPKRWKLFWE